jgi:methylmalonyl-CoA mutase
MGVNTFLSSEGSPTVIPSEVIRSTPEEKNHQVQMLAQFQKTWAPEAALALKNLHHAAATGGNVFESLMEATKYCSLGQITNELFRVGGQYRRNM